MCIRDSARNVLDAAVKLHPRLALIQIQRTGNCIGRESEFPQLLKEVTDALRTASFQPIAALELAKFAHENPAELCQKRDYAALEAMADALLENRPYADMNISRAHLLLAKAFAHAETNDIPGAIELFVASFRAHPNLEVVFYGASLMANAGEYDRVYAFLREAQEQAPSSSLKRML